MKEKRKIRRYKRLIITLLAAMAFAIGCAGITYAQQANTEKINVTVTLDGEPQPGLEAFFMLKSKDGTTYDLPIEYKNGKKVYVKTSKKVRARTGK